MSWWDFLKYIPEIRRPTKPLTFKERLKWTALAVIAYLLLASTPLIGSPRHAGGGLETLLSLLGARVGTLATLGVGPIVTGMLVLDLLVGGEIIRIDITTEEGRKRFHQLAKLFAIIFILLENFSYGFFVLPIDRSLSLSPTLIRIFIWIQLVLGGLIILLLDDLVSKWGIGSGISLFIAAGVSEQIVIQGAATIYSFFKAAGQAYISTMALAIVRILSTIVVFAISAYFALTRIEIPLVMGRVRGAATRLPISFLYTSNIPVILAVILIANFDMFFKISAMRGGINLGYGPRGEPLYGIARILYPPTIVDLVYKPNKLQILGYMLGYVILLTTLSVLFAWFWVTVAPGQSPESLAEMIVEGGLSIPGFRQSKEVVKRVLSRYIYRVAIVGGFVVGLTAALANLFLALARGTAILLNVMIIYQYAEILKRQYGQQLPEPLRRILE